MRPTAKRVLWRLALDVATGLGIMAIAAGTYLIMLVILGRGLR